MCRTHLASLGLHELGLKHSICRGSNLFLFHGLEKAIGSSAKETLAEELELVREVYPRFNQEAYLAPKPIDNPKPSLFPYLPLLRLTTKLIFWFVAPWFVSFSLLLCVALKKEASSIMVLVIL